MAPLMNQLQKEVINKVWYSAQPYYFVSTPARPGPMHLGFRGSGFRGLGLRE